jgi:signal recognition particle subunit SRP54
MFDTISKGFSAARNLLRQETTLSEKNIADALNEVRISLLDADVEYSVVKTFLSRIKERALGINVKTAVKDSKGQTRKLSASEHFIGICFSELEALMGPQSEKLELDDKLARFMMVGLQGSGKTTSSAKLARLLKEEYKRRPLLVAADIYRPGAAQQLALLGERLGVPVYHRENASAQEICREALIRAQELKCDALIFDTAGRLAIDEKLMAELDDIKAEVKPQQIYLVVDAMIGQDAVNTAAQFNKRLDVSGFILTKLDGDARGGAALSIKEITQKPIKFLGMGEDLGSLELFRPEGLASRILGMGDIVSLVKDFEKHVDEKEAEKDAERLLKGSFSFDDFIKQLKLMRKVGSFQSILERIPGLQDLLPSGTKIDEREFVKFEAMIFSMTKLERKSPELLVKQKSRRERVAQGSGRSIKELDGLLERFMMMRNMMQLMGKNPQALANSPMFKQMGRAAEVGKRYGRPGQINPMDFMGEQGSVASRMSTPKVPLKIAKDKRKSQKLARKKNKKRK